MEAVGGVEGAGTGRMERSAMMEASVKAQEVKKPKVVWRRVRALCILILRR